MQQENGANGRAMRGDWQHETTGTDREAPRLDPPQGAGQTGARANACALREDRPGGRT
jgi:hypothetical protein